MKKNIVLSTRCYLILFNFQEEVISFFEEVLSPINIHIISCNDQESLVNNLEKVKISVGLFINLDNLSIQDINNAIDSTNQDNFPIRFFGENPEFQKPSFKPAINSNVLKVYFKHFIKNLAPKYLTQLLSFSANEILRETFPKASFTFQEVEIDPINFPNLIHYDEVIQCNSVYQKGFGVCYIFFQKEQSQSLSGSDAPIEKQLCEFANQLLGIINYNTNKEGHDFRNQLPMHNNLTAFKFNQFAPFRSLSSNPEGIMIVFGYVPISGSSRVLLKSQDFESPGGDLEFF